jgi:hypothetical protein
MLDPDLLSEAGVGGVPLFPSCVAGSWDPRPGMVPLFIVAGLFARLSGGRGWPIPRWKLSNVLSGSLGWFVAPASVCGVLGPVGASGLPELAGGRLVRMLSAWFGGALPDGPLGLRAAGPAGRPLGRVLRSGLAMRESRSDSRAISRLVPKGTGGVFARGVALAAGDLPGLIGGSSRRPPADSAPALAAPPALPAAPAAPPANAASAEMSSAAVPDGLWR